MAKTFQELEEEEMRRRKENMENAQTLEEYRREKRRQEREALRLSNIYNKEVYEPYLAGRTPTQVVGQMRSQQQARSAADVAKAREDMASGKTSKLVGEKSKELKKVPTKQVFKAMVVGDPDQGQVFDTKEEAEAYLKQTGKQGAVAGIRVSGTPEEMKGSIAKYKEQAVSGKNKEEELKGLYSKRKAAAQERISRVKEGELDVSGANIEAQAQKIAETDPERAMQFESGINRIGANRQAREADIISQRIRNVAEGSASGNDFFADVAAKREAPNSEADYLREVSYLKNAIRRSSQIRDWGSAYNFEQQLKKLDAGVPREPRSRRKYFEDLNVQRYKDLRREMNLSSQSKANPF
jgi:hypothetical protein